MSIFCNHKWINIWLDEDKRHIFYLIPGVRLSIKAKCGKCCAVRYLAKYGFYSFDALYGGKKRDFEKKVYEYHKFYNLPFKNQYINS